ncbi:MAG: EAL domain-containing protein [Eubacteriales bacterium]
MVKKTCENFNLSESGTNKLNSQQYMYNLIQFICEQLEENLDCPCVWLGLKKSDGSVNCYCKTGDAAKYLDIENIRWDDSPFALGVMGQAIRTGVIQCQDLRGEKQVSLSWLSILKEVNVNMSAAIPILFEKSVIGALGIYGKDIDEYNENQKFMIHFYCNQISMILNQHNSEQKLNKFRLLSQYSRDIFLFIQLDGKIIAANKAAEKAYGYTIEELQTMNIYELRPENSSYVFNQMEVALEKGVLFEAYHRRKDGSLFPVEVSSRGENFEDGPLLLSVIRDISARKEMEEDLRQSEERYHEMFERMNDGVAIYTVNEFDEFTIKDINKAVEKIERIDKEKVKGKTVTEAFPGIKTMGLLDVFERVYHSGKDEVFQGVFYKDNRISGWRDNYVYKLSSGEIVAIYHDLTKYKNVQEQLFIEKERAIEILNAISDGMISTDIEGNIYYMNSAAEQKTGWRLEEAKDKHVSKVYKIENVDNGECVENCLHKRKNEDLKNNYVLESKNGQKFFIEDSVSEIKDRKGNVIGLNLVFSDITEKNKLTNDLIYMSAHDNLTKLPNRNSFYKHLNQSIIRKDKNYTAVMFMDIDRFKFVNDNFGHDVGDQLLIKVAKRIQKELSCKDIVARYGGDEFAIILNDVVNEDEINNTAYKLIQACSERFIIDKSELYISLSIGIAIFPEHCGDANSLIKNADIAMYSAKKNGGNRYHVFESKEDIKPFNDFSMIGMLNNAVKNSELELYYQPQYDMETGEYFGVEALLRWFSPKGKIMPNEFIPLAEETGLIVPIGKWVLKNACAQNKRWQECGYLPLQVSVNVSAVQFYQLDFVDTVITILNETKLDPRWLTLEINETIVMKNCDYTIKTINKLKAIGIKISIDDFGTGYSSLNYLANLAIDYLKIDKTFIQKLGTDNNYKNENISKAIINLAKMLEIEVIAEGVEKVNQLNFLRENKCHKVQGYLISKPISEGEFLKILKTNEDVIV